MKERYNPEYASNSLKIYTHFLETLLSKINPASSLIINALNGNLIEEFPLPPESQYERKSLDWVTNNLRTRINKTTSLFTENFLLWEERVL